MNYRHAYHAGNFADLFKHAVLLALLQDLRAAGRPAFVVDTHAGAGVYDLDGPMAARTGEGEAARALVAAQTGDLPRLLAPLQAAMRDVGGGQGRALYPGSPWLIGRWLGARDRALACEARSDDAAELKRAVGAFAQLRVQVGDGWRLAEQAWPRSGPALALIDPPFEASDDGARAARLAGRLARAADGRIAVWTPVKDLAGFDALAGAIEDAVAPRAALTLEARLRPADDPMRLNGCAMIVVGAPPGLAEAAQDAADWIVRNARA